METMTQFAALFLTAVITLFFGLALDWLLLHGMFRLMQPATAHRLRPVAVPIECGTRMAARAYSQRHKRPAV